MTELRTIITEAAWKLLTDKGLDGLSTEELSKETLIAEVKIQQLCPTSLSILLLLVNDITSKTPSVNSSNLSAHDILFESIMNHLDTASPYKTAIQRLVNELSFAPCWLMNLKPYISEWSRQRLNEANIETTGLIGSIRIQVFDLFCLYVLKIWADDSTPDQSLTLPAIDQGLKKLEDWQEMIRAWKTQ